MFRSPLFVIYGFDTASTLSEETRDPAPRAAPRAVLFSIVGAFIIGGVFLLGTLMGIPNLHTAINGLQRRGLEVRANVIEANFPTAFATLYLFVVSAAISRLLPVHHGSHHPGSVSGSARDTPAADLRAAGEGSAPSLAYAALDLHHGRRALGGSVHSVLGRWHHRDRCPTRHDLHELLPPGNIARSCVPECAAGQRRLPRSGSAAGAWLVQRAPACSTAVPC